MSEAAIRLLAFAGMLALMGLWERLSPRRVPTQQTLRRWGINLALTVTDTAALRLTLGAAAYGTAHLAQAQGWGLLALADWPMWLRFAAAFVVLDFAIYLQHVLSHALPVFWRLHRVHHTDLDFDTSTGVRFHPLEILLSMLFKVALVAALGAPPLAVVVFEIVLNATSLFNHGNVYLSPAVDRALRVLLVTPDMHRVHHSVVPRETDSNFGFNFSFWDRLCGTYRREPERGQLQMEIGLAAYRDPAQLGLWSLLLQPFGEPLGRSDLDGRLNSSGDATPLQEGVARSTDGFQTKE